MEAGTLHCPTCGAAIADDSTHCRYCGTSLATIACPVCFGRAFVGSHFCPHCGSELAWPTPGEAKAVLRCPACTGASVELEPMAVGATALHCCRRCGGVWVDAKTFDRICIESERQAAILGQPEASQPTAHQESARRYLPCPNCRQLMNKTNFARSSGIVIDVCKRHGVWFDGDELRKLVTFIHDGGVDRAREHERELLAEERRHLEALRAMGQFIQPPE
jgi:Zn-finger nucleic acid-binding protein